MFFLKSTKTSIGSNISSILSIINRKKGESQVGILAVLVNLWFLIGPSSAFAIVDPLAVPNNKFGIHIISPVPDEASPAASLVNSSGGDWGYVTLVIGRKDMVHDKWQEFFNDLSRRHLIPIVRLATEPGSSPAGGWKRPDLGEAQAWTDFLDSLTWPTKNRYVVIFNEPNQGQEWGGTVDPADYAKTLDKFITTLKNKNQDFFILNAGLDASAPSEQPFFEDEAFFLRQMNEAIPGIFDKLDGWVSHSYPNPGFTGLPDAIGRATVRNYDWELSELKSCCLSKTLPVFITETGWKHAEGLVFNPNLPSADTVGEYYKKAFEEAWSDSRIVTVTPFLLTYQEAIFDHFSFRKISNDGENGFYPQFDVVKDLPKPAGKPVIELKKAEPKIDLDLTSHKYLTEIKSSSSNFLSALFNLIHWN